MTNIEIFQTIMDVAILILGFYLAFFKSYFQEKGKNLATQEDIGAITENIESVKTDFQILLHSRTTINVEKRNSFLNYYDKYFLWLNILTDTLYGSIDIYKTEEIEKYQMKLNSIYLDLCNSEARMKLWNHDEDLIDIAIQLQYETNTSLYATLKLHLIKLKEHNLDIDKKKTYQFKNITNLRNCLNILVQLKQNI